MKVEIQSIRIIDGNGNEWVEVDGGVYEIPTRGVPTPKTPSKEERFKKAIGVEEARRAEKRGGNPARSRRLKEGLKRNGSF